MPLSACIRHLLVCTYIIHSLQLHLYRYLLLWAHNMHMKPHKQCAVCLFVLSDSTFPDWFHHKSMLSSHPLKLWSHRYVCSNCRVWRWIIHFFLFLSHTCFALTPHFNSIFLFLVFLISSPSFRPPPPPFVSILPMHGFNSLSPSSSPSVFPFLPPHAPASFFSSHSQPSLSHSLCLLSLSLLLYCQPLGKSQPSLLFIY